MLENLQIAIVGGGIGRLGGRACPAGARIPASRSLSRLSELREIGAGVSLFPNVTSLLQRIDLADRIQEK